MSVTTITLDGAPRAMRDAADYDLMDRMAELQSGDLSATGEAVVANWKFKTGREQGACCALAWQGVTIAVGPWPLYAPTVNLAQVQQWYFAPEAAPAAPAQPRADPLPRLPGQLPRVFFNGHWRAVRRMTQDEENSAHRVAVLASGTELAFGDKVPLTWSVLRPDAKGLMDRVVTAEGGYLLGATWGVDCSELVVSAGLPWLFTDEEPAPPASKKARVRAAPAAVAQPVRPIKFEAPKTGPSDSDSDTLSGDALVPRAQGFYDLRGWLRETGRAPKDPAERIEAAQLELAARSHPAWADFFVFFWDNLLVPQSASETVHLVDHLMHHCQVTQASAGDLAELSAVIQQLLDPSAAALLKPMPPRYAAFQELRARLPNPAPERFTAAHLGWRGICETSVYWHRYFAFFWDNWLAATGADAAAQLAIHFLSTLTHAQLGKADLALVSGFALVVIKAS